MVIPGYTQNPTGSTSTEDSNPPTQSQRWRRCLTSLASLIPPKLQKRKDRKEEKKWGWVEKRRKRKKRKKGRKKRKKGEEKIAGDELALSCPISEVTSGPISLSCC